MNSRHFLFLNPQYDIISSCAHLSFPTYTAAFSNARENDLVHESFILQFELSM